MDLFLVDQTIYTIEQKLQQIKPQVPTCGNRAPV
jgi:hypothetical protein